MFNPDVFLFVVNKLNKVEVSETKARLAFGKHEIYKEFVTFV